MSETSNGNGSARFDWRVLLASVLLLLIQGLVFAGIFYSTLTDHSRRLDLIEKRQEDNYLSRTEYERRHSDLQETVKEQGDRIRELERKTR